jgi:hypothetical protein
LKSVPILIAVALLFGVTTAYISILYLVRAFNRSKKRRSAWMPDFLRAPGQSSGEKIDYLNGKIERQAALLITLPLFLCSIYLFHLYVYKTEINPILIQIVVLAGAGLSVYFLVTTLKLIKARRMVRLGYESKMAVARELEQLVVEGNHVYHDFPAEDSNIDHIVVGRSGIFAVETGTHSKPAAAKRMDDATVEYNGKILMFPNGDDDQTIARAERQASYVSDWISSAVGEQVAARAIVALPGWFVKRTSPDGISVVNPDQFPSLFRHIKPRFLTDEMITRIVAQIEQKCRVVKPVCKANHSQPS